MEIYCALCGVAFGIFTDTYNNDYSEELGEEDVRTTNAGRLTDDDVWWTYAFIALRRLPALRQYESSHNKWYLSGVGMSNEGIFRAPPADYDAREDKEEHSGVLGDRVVGYTSLLRLTETEARDNDEEIAFPMHPSCWDLFLQNHALIGKCKPNLDSLGDLFLKQGIEYDGDGDDGSCGLRPDWMPKKVYGEVEMFWGGEVVGWTFLEVPWVSQIAPTAWHNPQLDYLVYDPEKLPDFQPYFENPPLLDQARKELTLVAGGAAGSPKSFASKDPFSALPTEICTQILCSLPTDSVTSLRLASRIMATVPLSPSYWLSRFEWPNELCHVKIPGQLRTGLDWRLLCSQLINFPALPTEVTQTSPSHQFLLSPAGEQGLLNRRRILKLTWRLVRRLLGIDSPHFA